MAGRKKQMSLGVALSYISIAVKMLSGILYTPIVLHSLGQSQYGIYSLCISFIGYLTILNAGVNAAYIRFYVQEKVKDERNVESLNGLFKRIFLILSAIGLVGGLLLSVLAPAIFGSKITPNEYDLARRCFILLAFTISVEIYTCLYKSFITANEEFIFGKSIDIIGAILAPVVTIPFLLNGFDCTAIISVRLGVSVLVLLLCVFFCRKKLSIHFRYEKQENALIRNISQFIGFIVVQSIIDQLNWQIDKFILARTHGTSEISIYTVGSTLNNYYMLIGAAVSGVFIAQINRLVASNDNEGLNRLYRKMCKLFTYLIMLIILAYIIFGRAFVARWAGNTYQSSYTIGWMLMTPVTWVLINGLGQDTARAKNKHQMLIILNLSVCILNVFVSIPLAIKWGAVGSALGTFIAEIVIGLIVTPIYYIKILDLRIKDVVIDFSRFLPGIVLPIAFGITINHFGILKSTYGSIAVWGMVFVIIYAASVWLLSMNKEDRKLVIGIVKKGKK